DEFPYLARTPANAAELALEKAGLTVDDIDLFEINEAFASVALNSIRMLDVPEDKVNVNGGAIALGHPIGASGARILMTLVNELRRRGGGLGVAAICSGGGQGDAVIVEVNEAFAAVALNVTRVLGFDEELVNVNGGAVALGHPIGASGARILMTLANELRRRGGGLGVAAICSGGGQGDAVILEVNGS
ncbi:MAG: hypothetical protein ACRDLD_14495, partial [Thermoleophilaceae bacterium]